MRPSSRRLAVDLYVRFDCSAADTIRELGYPSKGALLMWHRDRLVEERTGMPVMRGERYGRYTVEQKQAAVEFYLSHGRNLRRTMRHMGYPSHEVLPAMIRSEQARPVDVEGHVAEPVQYDQVGTADVPEHRLERAVAFGLAQPGARARPSGGTAHQVPCRSPSCPARSRDASCRARSCRRTPGPARAG